MQPGEADHVMTVSKKFMFDRSFDDPGLVSTNVLEPESKLESEAVEEDFLDEDNLITDQIEEEVIVPTYGQEDLDAAYERGVQEGKEAGRQDAWTEFRSQTDQMSVKALRVIGDLMQDMVGSAAEMQQKAHQDAVIVGVSIVQKLHPILCEKGALAEVESVIMDSLHRLQTIPSVKVTVHSSIVEALSTRLEPLLENIGFQGQITLEVDDSISVANCRVAWSGGSVVRDNAAMWKEINQSIRTILKIDLDKLKIGDTDATATSKEALEREFSESEELLKLDRESEPDGDDTTKQNNILTNLDDRPG